MSKLDYTCLTLTDGIIPNGRQNETFSRGFVSSKTLTSKDSNWDRSLVNFKRSLSESRCFPQICLLMGTHQKPHFCFSANIEKIVIQDHQTCSMLKFKIGHWSSHILEGRTCSTKIICCAGPLIMFSTLGFGTVILTMKIQDKPTKPLCNLS